MSLIHEEQGLFAATPNQLRQFILSPEAVLDYFPNPIEAWVIEEGKSIFCRGWQACSVIELVETSNDGLHVITKVSNAMLFKKPFTKNRVEKHCFFTMYEDWILKPQAGMTLVTKRWRDVEKQKLKCLPIASVVKMTAKKEQAVIIDAWSKRAQK